MTSEKDYFSVFTSVSKAISSTLNLKEVLDLILLKATDSINLKAGAISLWNRRQNRLELIAHRNLSNDFLNKGPILADKSMPGAILDKKPAIVSDISDDTQLQYPEACKKEEIGAIMSLPIIFKDEVMGILRLYDSEPRDFTFREVEFMTALSEQGGIAIKNARYMQRLEKDHEKEKEELWDWFKSMSGTLVLDG
ncbi:MAG: GAF domain-containing protein [Desulfobacteraceae bacterium]|nr:GAF domain-containing protein [Desulfobacteraceae bacterium]